MGLQAKQVAQQRLTLAPNVTLALEVLRMPLLELQMFLRQQAEENPLLEMDEPDDGPDDAPERTSDKESAGEDNSDAPTNGLDEEWLSHWNQEQEDPDEGSDEGRMIEQRSIRPESLLESLKLQLGCQAVSREQRALGEAVIHRLDEAGYLETPLEELASELGVPLAALESALRLIQRLDPPGVGARDLRECLMLQLEDAGQIDGLAYQIVRDHFALFAQHNLPALVKATAAAPEEVAEACEILKRLNPKPGCAMAGELPPVLVPDLVIIREEKRYDVELCDQDMPRLTVSRTYYRMLKDPRTPPDAKEFLEGKFRRASWLIKAIDERNATLLAIGRCLISLQRDFVEHGMKALKPLTQAQVASLIGRHASTVSRAIAGKTIATPSGIVRLEELFASGVPQAESSNGDVSDAAIKSEIRRLIDEEDLARPLSDEAIAKRLAARNISVARRTVAKYRTGLRILPAHLRRRRS
jgi:RNA polymerase sigma-54 factor